jgi:TolB-like protein/tetratricopeptide (TPR) repeat protein
MVQKTNSFERFWKELKRRKVIHVITVYAAVSFVILQLVDIVEQPLRLPDWTTAFVIVLLCIGFVVAIFLSWVYDITPAGVRKTKPVSAIKHSAQATAPTSSRWKIATYVSAIIIVALVVFNFIGRRNLNSDLSKLEKSIAVLPFFNDSPDNENSSYINGIMSEILNNLSKLKDLTVRPRTSVEKFRNPERLSAPQIGKELNVSYLVEGRGQKYGNTLRLTVQLIDAAKDRQIWTEPYDEELKDATGIFAVTSKVAQSIAAELKTIITPEEKLLIEKTSTSNLTAYDFYYSGSEEHTKYWIDDNNREALKRAEYYYREALKYDSKFAQAYVGLAMAYWDKHYWESYLSKNLDDSISILCDLALDYDNQLSDAHTVKGDYYNADNKTDQALEEYNKAIKINPNDYRAFWGKAFSGYKSDLGYNNDWCKAIFNANKTISIYRGPLLASYLHKIGGVYFSIGFMDKAKNCYEDAFKLDGDSANYYRDLSLIEIGLENYEIANSYLKRAYSIDTNKERSLWDLAENYLFLNQYEESLKYFKKWLGKSFPMNEDALFGTHRIGWAYKQNGYEKDAEKYFNEQINYCNKMIDLGRGKFRGYYDLTAAYASMGEKGKALIALKIFNQKCYAHSWFHSAIKHDPEFNSIRNEPEFQRIARDMDAKYKAEHDRVKKCLEEQGMLN